MPAVAYDYKTIAPQVKETLRRAMGENSLVVTQEGYQGRIHAKVVSERFDGMSEAEKQRFVWDILKAETDPETQLAVTFVVCYGTEDL